MRAICENGILSIVADNGAPVVSGISCGIRYNGNMFNLLEEYVSGPWTLKDVSNGQLAQCGDTSILFAPEGDGITVKTEYCRSGEDVPAVTDFVVLKGQWASRIEQLLGNTISGCNGNRTNEMQTAVETLSLVAGQSFDSSDFAAFITDDGQSYIAGYLSYYSYFGSVRVSADGTLAAVQFAERHPLKAGQRLISDIFYISACQDIVSDLPDYADRVVRYMTGKEPEMKFGVPSGYCTWYYFLGDIDEGKVKKAQDNLNTYAESLPVKYLQIDDGWEDRWGDWEPNEKFPEGMKARADAAKADGYIPGIWLAPFGASKDSKIFKEHPEYFICDWGKTEPRLGDWNYYDFDYSVEGAKEYLRALINKVTRDWGFKYLKLDIITPTIGPYRHSDPDFTACKNFREGMRIIRETAPEDTFILGCTAPFGSSIGFVDGMRVSGDIFERWDSICDVFNAVLKRYFYHNKFFINDADCLIIRKTENEDDECRRLCIRTDEEIKSYISAAAASGGTIMLSDKLNLLNDEQIKMLSYLFPLNQEAAVPLDLMSSRIPGVLDAGTRGKIRTVILINWENVPKKMQVFAGNSHVFEFWSQKYEGVTQGTYETTLQPHCCKVLFFTPSDEPAVVGTDSVLIPSITQSLAEKELTTVFQKKGEKQFVVAAAISSPDCEIRKIADNLFEIYQTGDKMTAVLNLE